MILLFDENVPRDLAFFRIYKNNAIDGAVLTVLLRKAESIGLRSIV